MGGPDFSSPIKDCLSSSSLVSVLVECIGKPRLSRRDKRNPSFLILANLCAVICISSRCLLMMSRQCLPAATQ
eukprot:Gb_30017 [translate_table: standard]